MAVVRRNSIDLRDERVAGVVAIVLGILVLIAPAFLNYVVAAALIIYGITRFT